MARTEVGTGQGREEDQGSGASGRTRKVRSGSGWDISCRGADRTR